MNNHRVNRNPPPNMNKKLYLSIPFCVFFKCIYEYVMHILHPVSVNIWFWWIIIRNLEVFKKINKQHTRGWLQILPGNNGGFHDVALLYVTGGVGPYWYGSVSIFANENAAVHSEFRWGGNPIAHCPTWQQQCRVCKLECLTGIDCAILFKNEWVNH